MKKNVVPIWQKKRHVIVLCVVLLVITMLSVLLIPSLRNSAQSLLWEHLLLSEANNPYHYQWKVSLAQADTTPAMIIIFFACAVWLCFCCQISSFLPAFFSMALLAIAQIYLGLSLPPAVNIAVFTLLVSTVACGRAKGRTFMGMVWMVALVSVLTTFLLPGTNEKIEAASERVKDVVENNKTASEAYYTDAQTQPMETRHENLKDISSGSAAAQRLDSFHIVSQDQEEISLPAREDLWKTILLLLLVPILLFLPFLPFVWMAGRTKEAHIKRSALSASDEKAACMCAFSLVIAYLDAERIGGKNSLYIDRLRNIDGISGEYREQYTSCAHMWQEMVYSKNAVTCDRRPFVDLLENTEKWLYNNAGTRERARLKYVLALHE